MRIGRHMPTNSKPLKAAQIAQQIGCEAIQIFASNPTAWQPPADNPEGAMAFAQVACECNLDPVVLHAPYLINLASPEDVNWEKSIALLTWTLQRGALLGAKYVIFHTGSHRGAGIEVGMERIAQAVARILPQTPESVMLLLENDVGAKNSVGHSFEQLAAILGRLPQYNERLGVCLDTAHLWGAGYDISQAESTRQIIENFASVIGLARLKIIHLNDTEKLLGSHRDVHARLGEGVIGEDGLRVLLTEPRLAHAAVIMETPIQTDSEQKEDWEQDAKQIAMAKSLLQPLVKSELTDL
ncbi:deoxyribonuclease IV [Ktedonosporobacter rubrisoli]|uniref:Probable endonuclease 4 n=1 Tax=Ktedonosporobacter rubrisoli TaxID=2509675 RepID=A0A4P6JY68_KTERU|nr:deoxyribonuclease IV [Ktedonosporobacter rubrisoli]QBD80403.1 deoxyribonuclease IV [Ktedonosporobacter rubrisoli]